MKKNIWKKFIVMTSVACVTTAALTGCSSISNLMSNVPKELVEDMKNNGFDGNFNDYIRLGQYKGLDVKKESHQVTEEEIQDELYTLASNYTTYEDVTEGPVKEGDLTDIDFIGKLDGVAFDGGTAEGYTLEIGSHSFISGFEEGLVGVNVGDTVDLNLTFPENYGKEDLAGQDVVFTVTVNSISRPNVPEVTDEFIKEVSEGQYENVQAFTDALTEQIISEYEEQYQLQYYEDLWNAAVANAEIIKDIPTSFISDKSFRITNNTKSYADSYGVSFNDFISQYMGISMEEYNAQAAEYARVAAKESLVLWAIANAEGITVTQEEIDAACQEYVDLGAYESIDEAKADVDYKYMYDFVLQSKVENFLAENAVK